MPIKPVNFEEYMKWFENHKVVKGQTASGIRSETTEAAANALIEKATRAAKPKDRTCLQIMENYVGKQAHENHAGNPAQVVTKAEDTEMLEAGADFESHFEYFVDDEGVVMIKCDGYTIGPAVPLDWETKAEEDEFEAGWEKVEGERDGEWNLV